jgi:hypothetical protein
MWPPDATKIIYLLSADLPYEKMICPDSGPEYARSMGWPTAPLEEIGRYRDWVAVIDDRISEKECRRLETYVRANREQRFVPKIVDPLLEKREQPYYQLLFRLADRKNVRYLSVYSPTELIDELALRVGPGRMVTIPYPFIAEAVLTEEGSRKRQIAITGADHPWYYPLRVAVAEAMSSNPLFEGGFCRLEHPGYPDVGHVAKHRVIGREFIRFLSLHMFMLVCPSRGKLELLKFTECAYANCVPVGEAPSSFTAEMASHVVPLHPESLSDDLIRVLEMPGDEAESRAKAYRTIMSRERDVRVLNRRFSEFLANREAPFPTTVP